MTVLCVKNLDVRFDTIAGPVDAVKDLRFSLGPRETLGIVGESGSGKTQAAMAMLGLLAANGSASGSVRLDAMEILNRSAYTLQKIRGRRIAMIFQDPMTSLNPYLSIGKQLALVLARHRQLKGDEAQREIIQMLDAVRLPNAKRRLDSYPHEFSGGMRQRVMIAAALLCRPEVLIADEPTTSLDVTVQAGILSLLRELRDAFGTAVILISHDLGVVAGSCEQMLVMQHGSQVEFGPTQKIFDSPQHEYTQCLLDAVPRINDPGRKTLSEGAKPVLNVEDLRVDYSLPRQRLLERRERFSAVAGLSLDILPGETLGVVGESGCGKSTLARAIMQLVEHQRGSVSVLGSEDLRSVSQAGRDMQLVFQDPLASLNPRMTIVRVVEEPLLVHSPELSQAERRQRVLEMLEKVGLDAEMGERYPHELSGGQCQRAGIARALITTPRLLICDEALSALDVSVQAGIVDLLLSLQKDLGLAILFIAHDLAVVRRMSHRLAVMYLGRVVEAGPAEKIYAQPGHPYSRALLDAVPVPEPRLEKTRQRDAMPADVPAPWCAPPGCAYHTRCAFALEACKQQRPPLLVKSGHSVACHRLGELPIWQSYLDSCQN
ncbi:MAG: ABC transporter ATP-binding protein [Pseudomonadota bacterium]